MMGEVVSYERGRVRRLFRPRLILPIALGVLTAASDEVSINAGRLSLSDPALYAKCLLFSTFFIILFVLLDSLLSKTWPSYIKKGSRIPKSKFDKLIYEVFDNFTYTRKSFIISFICIMLCWIPWLIMLSPGVYWSDTSTELIQYYGGEALTDHHPVLCTLIYGWFSDIGSKVFGSQSAGLFLLSVMQVVCASALFAALIIQLCDMGVSAKCGMAMLAFVALFPFFPVMFVSIVKDTLSAIPFLVFSILYLKIININNFIQLKKWQIVVFLLSIVLTALTKKTMPYIVIPATISLVFLRGNVRASRIAIACVAVVAALICFVAVPKFLLPTLGAAPGGKQEAIATLIQQVAHDVVFDGADMNDSEKEIVDDFLLIDYQDIPEKYNFEIVDEIKGRQLNNESRFWDFVTLWCKKTLQDPLGHFEAWLGLTHGWFGFRNADATPSYMIVCTESSWYYDPVLQYVDWPQPDQMSEFARALYDSIQSIPVVNVLFYRSTWASVIPTFLLYYAMKRRTGVLTRIVIIMPVLLSAMTLALTPVSGTGGEPTRYLLQIVCLAPFLLALLSCIELAEEKRTMRVGRTSAAHYPRLK